MTQAKHTTPAKMTNEDWIEEQMADPVIREIHEHLFEENLTKKEKVKEGIQTP